MTTSGIWVKSSAIVAAQSTQAIAIAAIALFLPIIREDLDISFAQAGLLAAVPTLCYAMMQLPVGVLADRVNPKYLFAIGVLATNALGILFAVTESFGLLLLVQSLAGLSRAFMFIPGLLLMTQQFSESRRASAMGLLFAGGLSSYVIVNLLGPVLLAPLGWRGFLAIVSLGGLAILVVFWVVAPSGHPAARDGATGASENASQRWVWRQAAWWLLGFIQFVRMGIMAGFTFWLPAYLVIERGLPIAHAGLIVAGCYAVTAVSNVAGSVISDRWNIPIVLIGASLIALTALLLLVGYVENMVLLIVVIALIAMFVQFYFGPLFVVPVRLFGPAVSGVSAGFGNFVANVGGFTASLGLGLIRDATHSFALGFICLAAAAALSLLSLFWLARLFRRRGKSTSSQEAMEDVVEAVTGTGRDEQEETRQ